MKSCLKAVALLAMAWGMPVAIAQTPDDYTLKVNVTSTSENSYRPPHEWRCVFSEPTRYALQAAVGYDASDTVDPNGLKIYTADDHVKFESTERANQKTIFRVGTSEEVDQRSYGRFRATTAIANDDANNVVIVGANLSTFFVLRDLNKDIDNNTAGRIQIENTGGREDIGIPYYGMEAGDTSYPTSYGTSGYDQVNNPATNMQLISAGGDILNGTGYIWFATWDDKNVIKKITVENVDGVPTATNLEEYTLKTTGGATITLSTFTNKTNSIYQFAAESSHAYVKQYAENRLFLQDRGVALYDVELDVNNKTAICTDITSAASNNQGYAATHNSLGATIYMFHGHRLLFCHYDYGRYSSTGSNPWNWTGQFEVIDLDDNNKKLFNIDAFDYGGLDEWVGVWVLPQPNPNDPYSLDLYVYKPGHGAAKYSSVITAMASDPVQNLQATIVFPEGNGSSKQNVRLTWEAPSVGTVTNYSIYAGEEFLGKVSKLYVTLTKWEEELTFKVVPNYSTGNAGDEAAVTIAPYVFPDSKPTLTIATIKATDENDKVIGISHFKTTTTWETPTESPVGYSIKSYIVELLDPSGNTIDTRSIAVSNGTEMGDGRMSYSLSLETIDELQGCTATLTPGNSSNHFVDNDITYTSRVKVVYDLPENLNDEASTSYRYSAEKTAQKSHDHKTCDPIGQVTVYEGTGTVEGVYRIEINIENAEKISENEYGDPVSHYEVSYTVPGSLMRSTEGEPLNNFILVTSSSQTEGASEVPGTLVRDGKSGKALAESKTNCFICKYIDYRDYVQPDPSKDEYKWVLQRELAEAEKPTNWTYNLTAVYADDNSLLRSTTSTPITVEDEDKHTTGSELLEGDELSLKAFPIPAGSTLTVQSPQGIKRITMLSSTGVVVKDIAGDGNTVMTIDVDDLTSGYYMLQVNDMPSIKVVKQ